MEIDDNAAPQAPQRGEMREHTTHATLPRTLRIVHNPRSMRGCTMCDKCSVQCVDFVWDLRGWMGWMVHAVCVMTEGSAGCAVCVGAQRVTRAACRRPKQLGTPASPAGCGPRGSGKLARGRGSWPGRPGWAGRPSRPISCFSNDANAKTLRSESMLELELLPKSLPATAPSSKPRVRAPVEACGPVAFLITPAASPYPAVPHTQSTLTTATLPSGPFARLDSWRKCANALRRAPL
eukprot:gene18875-biopygen913